MRGLPRGYFPETTKRILFMDPRNVSRTEEFLCRMRLKVVMGIWCIGGFIEYGTVEKSWLARKVEGWAESVGTLAGVSRKYPQSAYARQQKSLQKERAFVQRVTPDI